MPRSKAQQSEETIERLIGVAENHFSKFGYEQASTEKIVQEAKVTRGALYHHFRSKKGLFEAVVQALHGRIARKIEQAADAESTSWESLRAGCRALLEASIDPVIQKIVILDAPSVLGWKHWLQLDEQHGLRLLKEGLTELVRQEEIHHSTSEALLYLLNGALNQAAMWVSSSQDPDKALREAIDAFTLMLRGLQDKSKITE